MQITKLEIKNFKFHKELEFDIKGNLLIYGENGAGKSSIFEALKSNLYANKIEQSNIRYNYINRYNKAEELIVNISIDEDIVLNRIDDE